MAERLPAHVEAAALLRRVDAEGGFGTILKRGDSDRGSLILLIARRGEHSACLERTLGADGAYRWRQAGPPAGADAETWAGATDEADSAAITMKVERSVTNMQTVICAVNRPSGGLRNKSSVRRG